MSDPELEVTLYCSCCLLTQVMGPSCKIYALKRIRLQGRDPEAAAGFIDEIELLQRLVNKPNIIQLIESQVRRWTKSNTGG